MILVKKKHLYILTAIFCIILVLGEIKFFIALETIEDFKNIDIKYELENFIFSSIVLVLIMVCFLVYFMRKSDNILNKLDKMIEISAYGKNDIAPHLEQMGKLGEKVGYLMYNLQSLNSMKSLKISSLSGINKLVIERSEENIMLVDVESNVLACSGGAARIFHESINKMERHRLDDLFRDIHFEDIYYKMEDKKKNFVSGKFRAKKGEKDRELKMSFIGVKNAQDITANVLVVIEDGEGDAVES